MSDAISKEDNTWLGVETKVLPQTWFIFYFLFYKFQLVIVYWLINLFFSNIKQTIGLIRIKEVVKWKTRLTVPILPLASV